MAQHGQIIKRHGAWHLRYWDTFIVDGARVRKQKCVKLADICDRYRSKKDLQALRDEILAPLNSGKLKAESTMAVAEFAEGNWLPWARENCKPSTVAGYETLWRTYLAQYMPKISLRDFRTVDAKNLFAEIHRGKGIGRSTLQHCKSRLSGISRWPAIKVRSIRPTPSRAP